MKFLDKSGVTYLWNAIKNGFFPQTGGSIKGSVTVQNNLSVSGTSNLQDVNVGKSLTLGTASSTFGIKLTDGASANKVFATDGSFYDLTKKADNTLASASNNGLMPSSVFSDITNMKDKLVVATETNDGLMEASDYEKLSGIDVDSFSHITTTYKMFNLKKDGLYILNVHSTINNTTSTYVYLIMWNTSEISSATESLGRLIIPLQVPDSSLIAISLRGTMSTGMLYVQIKNSTAKVSMYIYPVASIYQNF